MNIDSELVFIVGPGSAGKSSAGVHLANEMGYGFIDIDFVFCRRIGLIPQYSREHGYSEYARANSALFEELVLEHPRRMVMPMSSGFLVHEGCPDLVERHRRRLMELGIPIVLLPDTDVEISTNLVVARQMARYADVNEATERQRFIDRYAKYNAYPGIKVFSHQSPPEIAKTMAVALSKLGLPKNSAGISNLV